MSSVRIRDVRLDDLPKIDALLSAIQYDVGVHIMELYFKNSKGIWQVAENENGEIVAFDSCNELPFTGELKGVQYGYEMFVREDYRSQGIIKKFATVYGTAPTVGNATHMSLKQINQFETFDMKNLGYVGQVNAANDNFESPLETEHIRVHLLNGKSDVDDLLVYDRKVYDSDRRQFMREWCTVSGPDQPYARTFLARNPLKNNEVIGFGTIRRYSDYYAISPLYADNDAVARIILKNMITLFIKECENEYLWVIFDAKNYLMMQFVHKMNFINVDSEMREYSRGAIALKKYIHLERAYAFFEYWPV